MPADKYVDTLPDMFEFAGENPIILWKPVVEKDFGQERFLPDDPTQLLQRGDFARVPIITGITEHEFVGTAVGTVFYSYKYIHFDIFQIILFIVSHLLQL